MVRGLGGWSFQRSGLPSNVILEIWRDQALTHRVVPQAANSEGQQTENPQQHPTAVAAATKIPTTTPRATVAARRRTSLESE